MKVWIAELLPEYGFGMVILSSKDPLKALTLLEFFTDVKGFQVNLYEETSLFTEFTTPQIITSNYKLNED